ncbi:hypothetical protein RND81_14G168400 [Saponaria officinalis]|uniref:Transcription repressor n=1 Tax=Saponaria officinalis TaxID=3572 RepID=A0AAW1GTM9_SAPOF
MPKNMQQSLQNYISHMKKQVPRPQLSRLRSLGSTTSKMLAICKHPKSLSFNIERDGRHKEHNDNQLERDEAATLEDIDKFLVENFKSLYGKDHEFEHAEEKEEDDKKSTNSYESESSGIIFDSPRFFGPSPDRTYGSHRFLTSSNSSGSLFEETRSMSKINMTTPRDRGHAKDDKGLILGVEDCVAVLTVTSNPYEDFRKSMEGVLDQRIHDNQTVDWDYMEELLFCYLRLNKKKQHTFILGAFVDLVVALRQN